MPHSTQHCPKKSAAKCFAVVIFSICFFTNTFGQQNESPLFRIGERLTYSISADRYPTAGFVEMSVISSGKFGTRDVYELGAKVKTVELFSAVVFLVDEGFTTFVDSASGMPVFVKRTNYAVGSPRERSENYLEKSVNGFDLLSMIYRLRSSFDGGSSILLDNGKSFAVTSQTSGVENIVTAAGTFETTILAVQSDYFKEIGISSLLINIDNSANRVPVMIRAKMQIGEVKVKLTSVQVNSPEPQVISTPIPVAAPRLTPNLIATPTPAIYVDNRPLSETLTFALGERLEYRVTSGAQRAGKIIFEVKERKQVNNRDSLLLTATAVEGTSPHTAFLVGDRLTVQVDPETLLPRQSEIVLRGTNTALSQIAFFDELTSTVSYGAANRTDIPVGTHNILSLFYAMRSFKFNQMTDLTNPINDTRVSVFWSNRALIFVLRPTASELTSIDGRKVPVIIANITTGDPQLDGLAPKVWLSADSRRVPLKFTMGQYNFDLESSNIVSPK